MKYFITDFKNREACEDLKKIGLYCYSLRSKEGDWSEIATIENNVLINLYGSIITNKEIKLGNVYPDDFISFNIFSKNNEKVNKLCDLKDGLSEERVLDLSSDNNILNEFDTIFEFEENFEELDRMSVKQKLNYIIKYYRGLDNKFLVTNGGHIYTLYSFETKNND